MRKDRRNVAGMLVMMRATAGDFDARVDGSRGARRQRSKPARSRSAQASGGNVTKGRMEE